MRTPHAERLEVRRLLAAIDGTAGDDVIELQLAGGERTYDSVEVMLI